MGEIKTILQEGIRVDFVQYESDDRALTIAWNTWIHDLDSNKYRTSSIGEKVSLVKERLEGQTPEDYTKVKTALLEVYGAQAESRVNRWLRASRTLLPAVLLKLEEKPELPQSYIFDNSNFTGVPKDKLAERPAITAITVLFDRMDASEKIAPEMFRTDICACFKKLHQWETFAKGQFKNEWREVPAVERILDSLYSETGRSKISRVPGALSIKPHQKHDPSEPVGLEELSALMFELSNLKEKKKNAAAKHGGMSPAESESAVNQGTHGNAEEEVGLDVDAFDEADKEDPVKTRAKSLMECDLGRVTMVLNDVEFLSSCKKQMLPGQRVVFLVDMPSSKAKLLSAALDSIEMVVQEISHRNFVICAFAGRRVTNLNHVFYSMANKWKKEAEPIVIMCGAKEGSTTKPTYCVRLEVSSQSKKTAPRLCNYMAINSTRASAWEGLHLRCMLGMSCPFKPQGAEPQELEVSKDDLDDDAGEDEEVEVEEAEDSAEEFPDEQDTRDQGARSDVPRRVFPFGRARRWAELVLSKIALAHTGSLLVVVSRSAHPGIVLGARPQMLKSIWYLPGVREHSVNHGKHLLETSLTRLNMAQAENEVKPTVKRVSLGGLCFIEVAGPPENKQAIRVQDVHPQSSAWRGGLDNFLADLDTRMPKLLGNEQLEFALDVQMHGESNNRILVAGTSHLGEGSSFHIGYIQRGG